MVKTTHCTIHRSVYRSAPLDLFNKLKLFISIQSQFSNTFCKDMLWDIQEKTQSYAVANTLHCVSSFHVRYIVLGFSRHLEENTHRLCFLSFPFSISVLQ